MPSSDRPNPGGGAGYQAGRLRRARDSELADLVELINEAYRIEEFFVRGPRIDLDEHRDLGRRGELLVLDDARNRPVACVYTRRERERAYLGLLSVRPTAQGHGLGRALVRAVEDRWRHESVAALTMHVVNLRHELREWYRRLGFHEVGRAAFSSPERQIRPCHFVVLRKALSPGG